MRTYLISLLLVLLSPVLMAGELFTKVESKNLVVGERGQLIFVFFDRDLDSILPEIQADGLQIKLQDQYPSRHNNRRIFVYAYQFVGVNAGKYTIPSVSFNYYGETLKSDPVNINVVDQTQLVKGEHESYGRQFTYYSKLFTDKSSLYPGESTELEYKVYLPISTRVLQWGLPTPATAENCTAWRFDTPNQASSSLGQTNIQGKEYVVASYRTVLTALNPGAAVLGEMETRIIAAVSVSDPRLGFTTARDDIIPKYPATTFTVKPFPEAPPKGYDGAVGKFIMETSAPDKTKIKESDSISMTINIQGEGNLPNLKPPKLLDDSQWSLIDSSRTEQGEERKNLSGSAEFKFIVKPTATATSTPRFRFIYFDPAEQIFKTLVSASIPMEIERLTNSDVVEGTSTPTLDTPQESMKDILGPIEQPSADGRAFITRMPSWSIHVIPACLLLWLLGGSAYRYIQKRKLSNSTSSVRRDALTKLEKSQGDFLKNAGAYIERWYPHKRTEELEQILHERDQLCYLPSEKHGIPAERRKEILNILRKLTLIVFFIGLAVPSLLKANEVAYKAWQDKDYQHALELYQLDLGTSPDSADLEYNIANCYYRLGKPGQAALHYYRALELDPFHVEARKNLTFLQSNQASILPNDLSDTARWISWLTPQSYKDIAYLAGWALLLSTLTMLLTKPRGFSLGSLITIQIIAPVVLISAIVFYYSHPDRKPSSETTEGVVLSTTPLFTEPYEPLPEELSNKTVIQATPASPCRIIARRGEWTYIELGNYTRGWLPSGKVESIKRGL